MGLKIWYKCLWVTNNYYTLNTENFNCVTDIPSVNFSIRPCDPALNRVVYYVFKLTQESYVQIDTRGLFGQVFNKDIRFDSSLFKTIQPIQPCMQQSGYIELCRLQPGTYTLVMFAGDAQVYNGCGNDLNIYRQNRCIKI